jgi:hypothetical protein
MKKLPFILHPSRWTWQFYLGVAVFLLLINLLGPRGLLQWVLLEQQYSRLLTEESTLKQEVVALNEEIDTFKNSRVAKERAIRDGLGYLRSEEGSVEFIDMSAPGVKSNTIQGQTR